MRSIALKALWCKWTIGWRSISRAVAIVSGIQGREPALQRAYSSQENQCNIMVPASTEDDVRSDLQKHTAKTLNESNVAIVLLNLSKDWAVWKRNNVSGSDVLTLWIINWLYEKLATQATQRIPLAIFLIHKYKMTKEKNFFLSLYLGLT